MSGWLAVTLLAAQAAADPWTPLRAYLAESVARRAFPGAVVAVGRRDTVLLLEAVGHLDYGSGRPTTTRTIYDIASLTKVVGLTTAAMLLVDEGRLRLGESVARYVPAFGAVGGDSVTVRDLLTHSAGLPAWRPYFRDASGRAAIFALVNATPLEAPPHTRAVYSDAGAIVLTQVIERAAGERLDRFLAARLFGPLGMRSTRYNPPASWRGRIAPTENDPWRGRVLVGEVHDENAAAMGGVSGHAGLFSTAGDLVRFAQMMLRGARQGHGGTGTRGHGGTEEAASPVVRAQTIAEFTRVQEPGFSSRALGWDTPSEGSSAGVLLSSRAYGHTGFTGTSLWIDPERNLFVILLTNRVHPSRDNELIREVRRRVADLAVEAAGSRD